MQDLSNLVVCNDGELELKVSVDSETIWLTQKQIAEVFGGTKQNISLHINNIYKEKELDKISTVKYYLTVQKEGNREVTRNIEHYNLDMILSLGYRINSIKATKFRQWATSVLKNYIQNGYAINNHKITEQRLFALENDMQFIKSKIKNNSLEFNQNIFFDGQIYDAYSFVNDLLKLVLKHKAFSKMSLNSLNLGDILHKLEVWKSNIYIFFMVKFTIIFHIKFRSKLW